MLLLKVPKQSVTMGLATVMNVKELITIFCGTAKAIALYKTVECTVSHMCPSSLFQLHNNCSCVCDMGATMHLRVSTSKYFCSIKASYDADIGNSTEENGASR